MKRLASLVVLAFVACQTVPPAERNPIPLLPPLPVCPAYVINDHTDEPWNDMDRWNLSLAIKRCPVLYKNSPCLVKFIKFATNSYGAICGGYDG